MFRIPKLLLILAIPPLVLDSVAAAQTDGRLAPLLSGMGVYSRPISTDSILAQRYFDQGLNLTYGYYFVHAVASFQEGLRHDSGNPMLYWGIALAAGPNPNSRSERAPDDPQGVAKDAIKKAMELRKAASPLEQALIEALHVRFDDGTHAEQAARDQAYISATRALHERYPDDLEIAFMLADAIMTNSPWSYWDRKGRAKAGTKEASDVLTGAVARHPLHPGANHLYIHLYEASNEPERATAHANRLASLAPHVGHIVHMPSHIFIRTGRYQDAIDTNLRSAEVDQILLAEWGDHPHPMVCSTNISAKVHTGHATDFVRFAATFQGNYELASAYARKTRGTMPIDSVPNRTQRPVACLLLTHKIFQQWDELDQEQAPPSENAYLSGIWHYVHGSKFADQGDLAKADEALQTIRQLQSHPDIQDLLIFVNSGAEILKLAASGLEGEIALARDNTQAAVDAFKRAAEQEAALSYMEPPDWPVSMQLKLGKAYLKAGKPRRAEKAFRNDLAYWPENARALFGLSLSLEAQGKNDAAAAARERYEAAWSNADVELDVEAL